MLRVVSIVEGHGDVEAVPLLLRRIFYDLLGRADVMVLRSIRVPKTKLVKSGELERAVELAARQTQDGDAVLILIDADDDCPAELAPQLLSRATETRADRHIRVVLANKEYEAWFLAAVESIAGHRHLRPDLTPPAAPETIRDAKGWLTQYSRPQTAYRETLDQPALTQIFDLNQARTCPSFDKLCRDMASLFSNS
ncbi:MAG: hypothetical protein ETSY1_21010 [Candidatus Entotheonella factor]|uniref:DUF4276 family protein n=1 Tax=Entotheonella factor TaxID=1429438 RepID=W4LJL3_ENTF1|nr:DUF4276 family protein [Candidatus Entotheonella palauensis]ETW97885.1 MAG: hypothetical protein ETSY1_21010 [Candidatus Entotheonella factor]